MNPRPSDYDSPALPLSYAAIPKVATLTIFGETVKFYRRYKKAPMGALFDKTKTASRLAAQEIQGLFE